MSGAYYYIVSLFIVVTLFTSPVFGDSDQQRLIDLVNQYRKNNSLPAVPTSYWLTATAMIHTIDRRDNGYPDAYGCSSGHSWSGKSTIFTGPCCYSGATWECMGLKPGEISKNRYTGVGYEDWVEAGSVEDALIAWKGSEEHNEVILNLNGWAGSTWKAIGAGVCGGFYGLWFSETADPDGAGNIDLLTCSMTSDGPVPSPAARVANPSPAASSSSAPSETATPSKTSEPSPSSKASLTASPSKTSEPSVSSQPSESSKPSITATPSKTSEPSESSKPSMTKTPSKTSDPSQSASHSPTPNGSPKLWLGGLTVSDNDWRTITMDQIFVEPVIVCSMYYTKSQNPLATRMRNVIDRGNKFDIQIVGTLTVNSTVDIHCVAIESGTYTSAKNGITIEAKRVLSTITNSKYQWQSGTSITFANTYTNPVVLGQVMTANDAAWSVFYARGSANSTALIPTDATNCVIGKQVGEDPNTVRANEQLGYIVIEAGTGSWGERKYEAIKGAADIYGFDNSPPYYYTLSGKVTASFGINSVNSVIGTDGGWSVFYGNQISSYQDNKIALAIDEDNIADAERYHGNGEAVGVLLFD